MAALGCALSPETALEEALRDQPANGQGEDDADEGVLDRGQDADEQPTTSDEDEGGDDELDSTKDAVRVNESDASGGSGPRDAGVASGGAAQGKADAATVDAATVDAGPSAPVKDAAVVDAAPIAVARCIAGTYVGAFSLNVSGGLTRDSFEGTITLQLTGSGDKLAIQSGNLSGKDAAGNPLTAKVGGSLNCLTQKLEGGVVSDGVFEQRGALVSSVRFGGTIAASYGAESSSLQGSWTLESALKTRSGSGRFTALLQK